MTRIQAVAAAAEAQLLEAARRLARQDPSHHVGRVALVLHLATLRPPAPRPHHRRIARAVLQDAALRHGGQVFVLRNGDLVLLCRESGLSEPLARDAERDAGRDAGRDSPRAVRRAMGRAGLRPVERGGGERGDADAGRLDSAWASGARGATALADALHRLLRIDVVDPARLLSIWPLERDHHRLIAYAAARVEERLAEPTPSDHEPAHPPGVLDEIGAVIGTARIHDLMQRQTAVVLLGPEARAAMRPDGGGQAVPPVGGADAGSAMRPIFREVTFSIAALEARATAGGAASADPFLFRHLAGQLDRRMLALVREELGRGGPLDLSIAARAAPPLHLNLTLEAILSPGFAAFAAACRAAGATAGVEISLIEACADSRGFAAARAAVVQAGMALVLDGVSHLALLLAAPGALEPDLLKLDWSPRMADLSAADRDDLAGALAAIGPHRVVLQRAETEAALRWGMAHGIRRFQGRHVDAMLGASRIMGCPISGGCTLRQCIERAAATGPAARAGCGNTALLDAAAPPRQPAPDGRAAGPEAGRAELPARAKPLVRAPAAS